MIVLLWNLLAVIILSHDVSCSVQAFSFQKLRSVNVLSQPTSARRTINRPFDVATPKIIKRRASMLVASSSVGSDGRGGENAGEEIQLYTNRGRTRSRHSSTRSCSSPRFFRGNHYKMISILYLLISFVIIPKTIDQYMMNSCIIGGDSIRGDNQPVNIVMGKTSPSVLRSCTTTLVGGSLGHVIASIVAFLLYKYDIHHDDNDNCEERKNHNGNSDHNSTSTLDPMIITRNRSKNLDLLNLGLFFFSFFGIFVVPGELLLSLISKNSLSLITSEVGNHAREQSIISLVPWFFIILFSKCFGTVTTIRRTIQNLQPRGGQRERHAVDKEGQEVRSNSAKEADINIDNDCFDSNRALRGGVKRKANELMRQLILQPSQLFFNDKKRNIFEMNSILQHDNDDRCYYNNEEKKKNKDAIMYRGIFFILFCICLGNNVMSLFLSYPSTDTMVKDKAIVELQKSLHVSAIARLSLISSIVLWLKNTGHLTQADEKSEKDELLASTYIILNLALGSWAFIVGILEGVKDDSFVIRKSLNMLMLSWPFFYKGITSLRNRHK